MRARIKVLVDKIGMDAFREMVDEELEGDWVDERDFSIDHLLFVHDEEANAPRSRSPTARPNGDRSEFDAFVAENVQPAAPGGLRHRGRQGDPRRPHPRAVPRPRRDHARVHAAATPAPRCSRTWCCAGSARSRSTTSGSASRSSASARPAPSTIDDVVSCPGTDSCKLGITSSMGLNRAIDKRIEEMEITDPLTQADPHQDERLPERLRPAPHRHDRLLRRLDQGRRPHDPRLHPAHRRQLRARRRRLRRPPQGPAARQARAGRRRALDPPLRGRSGTTARASTSSPSASARSPSRS